jgi:aspartyl-tRNA(Asn)/glutamyl-tRNA(Gln) amidotransferase subunit A
MSSLSTPAGELLTQLSSGDISSAELTQACLDQISAVDDDVKAFLHVDAEFALEQARAVDSKRAAGEPLGALAGIPVAVKDVICHKGQPCTCASRYLRDYVSPYSATSIEKLQAADAVLLGRTNMDEFAMGSSTENSAYQKTQNPWKAGHTPGGSSGGSAAAVASRMAPLALGSDTGGSIRQPASFCGIVGMKPTYGRVSRYGLVAFASSLDQVGPFASDVTGAAALLQAVLGHDPMDSTSINQPVPDVLSNLHEPLKGLKIGVVKEFQIEGLDEDVNQTTGEALDVYRALGAEVKEVSLPHARFGVATYYIIAPAEASSNLARYDGVHFGHRAETFDPDDLSDMYRQTREEGFGKEVKRRIMMGTFVLSAGYSDQYYAKALKVRRLIREDYDKAFETVDFIASPACPTPAFRIGELIDDPLAMYLSDMFTLGANLAGIPGISIPAGFSSDGLPIGLQLLGAPLSEARLLRAARMFEEATEWHQKIPVSATGSEH